MSTVACHFQHATENACMSGTTVAFTFLAETRLLKQNRHCVLGKCTARCYKFPSTRYWWHKI